MTLVGVRGVRGVHHVAFRVADVRAVAAFYEQALGLVPEASRDDEAGLYSIWLRAGDTLVMIERRGDDEPAPATSGRDAVLFAIDASERGEAERRLEALGIPLDGATAFSIYVRDPEGRRVGLSHYPARADGA